MQATSAWKFNAIIQVLTLHSQSFNFATEKCSTKWEKRERREKNYNTNIMFTKSSLNLFSLHFNGNDFVCMVAKMKTETRLMSNSLFSSHSDLSLSLSKLVFHIVQLPIYAIYSASEEKKITSFLHYILFDKNIWLS